MTQFYSILSKQIEIEFEIRFEIEIKQEQVSQHYIITTLTNI